MELQQYNLFFLYQETFALTKRLFIQLKRRPSTLLAGILQPIIWLFLFGALFSRAPEGFLPGVDSYGNFLGAGLIVFTAFSGALILVFRLCVIESLDSLIDYLWLL